jgi:hypothetical protein
MKIFFLGKVSETPTFRGDRVALYFKEDGQLYFKDRYSVEKVIPSTLVAIPAGGAQGQVLKKASAANFDITWANDLTEVGEAGVTNWGDIIGTLSNQTDLQTALSGKSALSHIHIIGDITGLQTALDGKAALSHNHSAANITSGTLATARLGSGTADSSKFLRGDQTWAVPPTVDWVHVSKTSDTSKINDTIVAADPVLQFSMAVNTKYAFEISIIVSTFNIGGGGPNIDYRIAGPASPSYMGININSLSDASISNFFLGVYSISDHILVVPVSPNIGYGMILIKGVVANGANAGSLSFQWAQNNSKNESSIVKAGSWLRYRSIP